MHQKSPKTFVVPYVIVLELVEKKWLVTKGTHLSLAVNVLTNSPKISDTTKTDIFQLNFWPSDETIWKKGRRAVFRTV